ncbi:hypothetical protein LTR56_025427 [Elasticomyces elasticus]|nr:hypothetical protein LTR56_025427 [Elasticomyces elasticus]KAK3620922.1 hypothetical protein LTR22_025425 [Elasticomyces elasticus]KAK4904675.1 hypothetical protein LTR49_025921 [Elasticomyces elasticus]KAK5740606.1 hypothetical protein LTS12_024894 [Elasticomyces elasticus]
MNASLVPLTSPAETYHGLNYGGFVVAVRRKVSSIFDVEADEGPGPAPLTGGVEAHTAPNVAAATLQTDEIQLGSLSLQPFGTISAAPGTKAFDLSSFYFGCFLNDHTAAAVVSQGCTVAVTGFYLNGAQAPEVTFAFAPTSPTAANQVLATLPITYSGLKNVTFGVAGASVLAAGAGINVDNLCHCNYVWVVTSLSTLDRRASSWHEEFLNGIPSSETWNGLMRELSSSCFNTARA